VEPDKRRLGLSLKRVAHGEYMDEDWRSALAEVNTEEAAPPEANDEASLSPAEEIVPAENPPTPTEPDLPDEPTS
jgi:hypothetical protein